MPQGFDKKSYFWPCLFVIESELRKNDVHIILQLITQSVKVSPGLMINAMRNLKLMLLRQGNNYKNENFSKFVLDSLFLFYYLTDLKLTRRRLILSIISKFLCFEWGTNSPVFSNENVISPEAYLEPCQTFKMECFAKVVKG